MTRIDNLPSSQTHPRMAAWMLVVMAPCWGCGHETATERPQRAASAPRIASPAHAQFRPEPAPRAQVADRTAPAPKSANAITDWSPSGAQPGQRSKPGAPAGRIEGWTQQRAAAFFRALGEAERGRGQARLVFYGASHVASDLFTGQLRLRLQQRFGEAGPGFVMPAKPWRYYRNSLIKYERQRGWTPLRVRVNDSEGQRLGLAGVAIEARTGRASTRLRTRTHEGLSGYVGRLELIYAKQPKGGSFIVRVDDRPVLRASTDAAAWSTAYGKVTLTDGPHEIELRARGDGPVRIYGMLAERARPGVVLDTLGVPGSRARYQFLWQETELAEQLRHRDPHLLALAYGTNEAGDDDVPIAEYAARLRRALSRLRGLAPRASCLLIGPSDRPRKLEDGTWVPRSRTTRIVETQRTVAESFGCGFFDLVAFMGGPLSMLQWVQAEPALGHRDHIHFTREGYEKLGETLFAALLEGYRPARAR